MIERRLSPAHATALNALHPEIQEMVNKFLESKNLPLQVHSMRFADASPEDVHCCIIDGMIHCGPECP
jgi:hypothetical protein